MKTLNEIEAGEEVLMVLGGERKARTVDRVTGKLVVIGPYRFLKSTGREFGNASGGFRLTYIEAASPEDIAAVRAEETNRCRRNAAFRFLRNFDWGQLTIQNLEAIIEYVIERLKSEENGKDASRDEKQET